MMNHKSLKILFIMGIIIVICISSLYIHNDELNVEKCITLHHELELLQNELNIIQSRFDKKMKTFQNNLVSKEKITQYSNEYNKNLEILSNKYDDLEVPANLLNSINLFKLSVDTQQQSNNLIIKWIQDNNQSNLRRSYYLLQNSYEYESGALSLYNSKISQCN